MAELTALRIAPTRVRLDRRRVQRRGGQRVPRLGRERHARKRPGLDGDGGLTVARGRGARRLQKVGRRMGVALARDRDVGARRWCVPRQRRRPLLLVQVVVDGRPRTGRARCTCDRGPRRQPRRPRRPSTRDSAPRKSGARCFRWSTPASRRPTYVRGRRRSGCARGTSPPRHVSRRACRTGPR